MFKRSVTLLGLCVLLSAILPSLLTSCANSQEDISIAPSATYPEGEDQFDARESLGSTAAEDLATLGSVEVREAEKELWGNLAELKAAIKEREQRLAEAERVLMQRDARLSAREATIKSREASFRRTELIAYGSLGVGIILIIAVVVSEIRSRLSTGTTDDGTGSSRQSTKEKGKTEKGRTKKKTGGASSREST